MAETATYSWLAFDRNVAVEGTLVGFKQTNPADLSLTGHLTVNPSDDKYFDSYKVVILGYTLWIDDNGAVTKVFPDDGKFSNGQTLQMVVCTMKTTYGTQQAITRAVSDDCETTANVQALEPRDQFALQALTAILRGLDHPEAFADASILHVCQSAYRWAQGMMIAAADARAAIKKAQEDEGGEDEGGDEGDTTEKKEELDVNTAAITDTTEKLLYNLCVAIDNLRLQEEEHYKELKKNGYKVVGSDAENAVPVKTEVTKVGDVKVKELPEVKVSQLPNVTLNGTPSVNVANTPDVRVTNMPSVPSEPVTVTGTVNVGNLPESSSSNDNA